MTSITAWIAENLQWIFAAFLGWGAGIFMDRPEKFAWSIVIGMFLSLGIGMTFGPFIASVLVNIFTVPMAAALGPSYAVAGGLGARLPQLLAAFLPRPKGSGG